MSWVMQRWRILTQESEKEAVPCIQVVEEVGPVVSISTGEGKLDQVCDIDMEGQGESNAPLFSSANSLSSSKSLWLSREDT